MSFLKKYACLYGEIEFTPEEEKDLGEFAARLMKLAMADDEDGVVDLFREEFGDIDKDTFDKIDRYMDFLSEYDKEAQAGMSFGKVLAPLSLALAAAPLVGAGIKSLMTKSTLASSLKKAKAMHPELRNDPNVGMYFDAIASFAPDVAKNPLVAGNMLVQMHRVGPTFVTPQLIKELIGMQHQSGKPLGEIAGGTAKGVIDVAKYYQKPSRP
jgi:hypothetical protein